MINIDKKNKKKISLIISDIKKNSSDLINIKENFYIKQIGGSSNSKTEEQIYKELDSVVVEAEKNAKTLENQIEQLKEISAELSTKLKLINNEKEKEEKVIDAWLQSFESIDAKKIKEEVENYFDNRTNLEKSQDEIARNIHSLSKK